MGNESTRDARLMTWGAASIWLCTGVGVLHPYYRSVGEGYLDQLGLPHALMWLTCAGEVVLGVVLINLGPKRWLIIGQCAAIVAFTVILGVFQPMLLVHPFGMLTKNLPLLALIIASGWVATEGWTVRAQRLVRGGMALIWITEGLFPKILFQQDLELAVVANSGVVPMAPSVFLVLLGVAQMIGGVLAVALTGGLRRAVVSIQLVSLVVLPLAVSVQDPTLWFHPFGPMTKNLPIIVGTWLALRRC